MREKQHNMGRRLAGSECANNTIFFEQEEEDLP